MLMPLQFPSCDKSLPTIPDFNSELYIFSTADTSFEFLSLRQLCLDGDKKNSMQTQSSFQAELRNYINCELIN